MIRLRDVYARPALDAYVNAAYADSNDEYAADVAEMADRSGDRSPFCKTPD